MIFAAGLGKRLGNITKDTPKALVEINGKTILRLAVEKVTFHGFDDIIVNVHHHADLVEKEIEKLKKDGFIITVSDERELLLETGAGCSRQNGFLTTNPSCCIILISSPVLTLKTCLSFIMKRRGLPHLRLQIMVITGFSLPTNRV